MLIGMNSALNQAPPILQGFCELLGEHLGAIISVLITLSIPSNDGNIEMRRYISEFNFCSHPLTFCSYHYGTSTGYKGKKWPQQFPDDFTQTEESMIKFAARVFSKEECAHRAICPDAPVSHCTPFFTSHPRHDDPSSFALRPQRNNPSSPHLCL